MSATIEELVDEAMVLVGDLWSIEDCFTMEHHQLQLQQYLVEIKGMAAKTQRVNQ